jgi:hypothetical protein
VASFTRIRGLADVIGIAATISIPIYATLALRRVYGGSLVGTLAKEVGIAVVYGLASLVAFVVTLYWVSVAA